MLRIVLLILLYLNFTYAEFIRDDTNYIVIDTNTNLMWQDNANVTINYRTNKTNYWEDAITDCESLELGGYTNWRMPNINELKTLIVFDENKPSISPIFIEIGAVNTETQIYWSSTTYHSIESSGSPSDTWYVDFYNTKVNFGSKTTGLPAAYNRCVRNR